ncbi:MAG: HupE/UreJ family protein [Epsilonproteobacteria bacterium]|nr:HupE/UreJ family protein [Campylobacterota bacterium]
MLKFFLIVFMIAQASLFGHTGVGSILGFEAGFSHPIGGADHILAMVAVGLWAAQMGGRSLWAVPLSFVVMMVVGTFLGIQGVHVPFIEEGILASVLVLGAMIGFGVKMPIVFSSVLVGVLAIFHGTAHGIEMPLNTSGVEYGIGFVLATGMIHISGIVIGLIRAKIMKFKVSSMVKRTNV